MRHWCCEDSIQQQHTTTTILYYCRNFISYFFPFFSCCLSITFQLGISRTHATCSILTSEFVQQQQQQICLPSSTGATTTTSTAASTSNHFGSLWFTLMKNVNILLNTTSVYIFLEWKKNWCICPSFPSLFFFIAHIIILVPFPYHFFFLNHPAIFFLPNASCSFYFTTSHLDFFNSALKRCFYMYCLSFFKCIILGIIR